MHPVPPPIPASTPIAAPAAPAPTGGFLTLRGLLHALWVLLVICTTAYFVVEVHFWRYDFDSSYQGMHNLARAHLQLLGFQHAAFKVLCGFLVLGISVRVK